MKNQIGVVGLAVMGKNLAYNIADHGFSVSVFNRTAEKTKKAINEYTGSNINGFFSIKEFVESLETPKKILLMVKAGEAVDQTIEQIVPFLTEGDLIIDGGNSYYLDTVRRTEYLNSKKLNYLGVGISGGEEGARNGPSIMPGGSKEAYSLVEPILTAISAKAEGKDCCSYLGPNGAGHFVKMVHNGIEYADMQLICEAYSILKNLMGLNPHEIADIFADWNTGELNSYLIGITADIFKKKDDKTGKPLVDLILDSAGQKGTGKWTAQISLDLGVPVPTITSAVYERYLSAMKDERVKASEILKGPTKKEIPDSSFIESIRRALYASKICAYAQGFSMLRVASEENNWNLQYSEIAKIFRGGCIIRAQFLNEIAREFDKDNQMANLLTAPYFVDSINSYQADWRSVIAKSVESGVPVGAFSSALSYFDNYRSKNMPMNLLQAQRDYFGSHTYQRVDMDGVFHTQWD
ncbi:MAG: phosphogluconate dehydrogenase (NADP(+)-dependent, decarboxylating) [Treponema sp. CETP13]|nr:MAG: phosphogluconate dehydrogenase (NADP(+)-dependent, decarboxylating) [Treponema sp. CETP13]